MKTAILAASALLVAETALANGASEIPGTLNDESLLYYWDFSASSDPVKSVSETTWGDPLTHNADGGYGSFTENTGRMWSTTLSNGNVAANSFTISLDFANFQANAWKNLFTVYTDETANGDNNSLNIQKTGDDALALYAGTADNQGNITSAFGGATVRAAGVIANGVIGVSTWQTITLTSDGTHLCAYVDGALAQSFGFDAAGSTLLSGLQVGSAFAVDDGGYGTPNRVATSGDIDNLAIWNRALSADEVRSLVVPEPSAFGLLAGIGALALVAARRRSRR